jgi:hypothetical protein
VRSLEIIVRYAVGGLLLAVGLATALLAQTSKLEHCRGLTLFGPNDSLNKVDLQVAGKDLLVRVTPNGPELHMRLEPDSGSWSSQAAAKGADRVHRVGWIRVFSCETGALVQSLEVKTGWGGPEFFLRFFEVKDVNFDGYLDLAVLRDGGATWGNQVWWVFSPVSGRFVSNDFTKALSQIDNNGLYLDAVHQNITAYHYSYSEGCGSTKDIYHVEHHSRLMLVHGEDPEAMGNGCRLTTRDLINGEMRITKVQLLHEFPH